jgi:Domain of unknown function (DUF4136)
VTTTLKFSLISLVVCVWPALAGEAKNDFDPNVDFSQFKTFAFIGGIDIEKSGWLDEPEMHERFKNFISGALETRGLAEVPLDQKHSLAVRFWVARRQKQEVTVVDYGPTMAWGGYAPYWGGAWGYSYEEYVVHNYIHGTMVVDLIDPATKELVWRTFVRQKIEDRAKAYVEAKKNLYRAVSIWPPSAGEKEKMRRARAKLEAKYK